MWGPPPVWEWPNPCQKFNLISQNPKQVCNCGSKIYEELLSDAVPPKFVMAMTSCFLIPGRARCCLVLPLSHKGFAETEMRGAVLLLPGWKLWYCIISAWSSSVRRAEQWTLFSAETVISCCSPDAGLWRQQAIRGISSEYCQVLSPANHLPVHKL